MPHSFVNNWSTNMRVLLLTLLVVTIILAHCTTYAEEDDDVHIHFHLTPGDGELKEDEEETKKEDGADYIGGVRTGKEAVPKFMGPDLMPALCSRPYWL